MRYDSEHKARTRERVLKEASAAIRAEGAERVGVADIMARAGLTHGGFYAHFKNKDDMVAEAIGYMFEERYAKLLKYIDKPDARSALENLIDNYLSMRHRDAVEQGCPIPPLAGEVGRMSPAARTRFTRAVDQLTHAVERLLDDMGLSNPAALASSILAEMVGSLSLSRAKEDRAAAEGILANSCAALKERLGLVAK